MKFCRQSIQLFFSMNFFKNLPSASYCNFLEIPQDTPRSITLENLPWIFPKMSCGLLWKILQEYPQKIFPGRFSDRFLGIFLEISPNIHLKNYSSMTLQISSGNFSRISHSFRDSEYLEVSTIRKCYISYLKYLLKIS